MNGLRLLANTVYDTPGWGALGDDVPWSIALGLAAAIAAAAALAYGWRERRLAPRGWGALLALRLTAIAATVFLLAGIERRPMTERTEASRVVVLTDRSASMGLPATSVPSAGATRSAAAEPLVEGLTDRLSVTHELLAAEFDVTLEYITADESNQTSPAAGAATRIGDALARVLTDFASTPLAGVVLVSDGGENSGADPREAAARAAALGVPIHTIGVGPLQRPPSVGLRDLTAPRRAASGDDFRAVVTIASDAIDWGVNQPPRVTLDLRTVDPSGSVGGVIAETEVAAEGFDDSGLHSVSTDLEGLPAGEYELRATLTPGGPDVDPRDNELTRRIEFVDQPTRVLLAAGGPSRDYRFLRDQLFRDDLFQCDVLLQSAAGPVTQDADRLLDALPGDADEWEAYDVVVAVDLDWRLIDAESQASLAEWVSRRGGGLVFAAGGVHTPGCLRTGFEAPLRTLLPVKLRNDPLALGFSAGGRTEPRRIYLASAGRGMDWLALAGRDAPPEAFWDGFGGFYAETLAAETKPGATVLATLDQGPDATPLLAEQLYGAGRVVYLAAAETWRLRTVDPAAFTAMHVGLLRHASQGRLLGDADGGDLLFDRSRYDLGERITLRLITRGDAVTAPTARLTIDDGPPRELSLQPVDGQAGVASATLRADAIGRYRATLASDSGEPLNADAEVSLPALENETRTQNAKLLQELAEATGGVYLDAATAERVEAFDRIVLQTPSVAETTLQIGPPDPEFAQTVHRSALAMMAGALMLEWLLRRLWRLA